MKVLNIAMDSNDDINQLSNSLSLQPLKMIFLLQINDLSTQTEACVGCTHLLKENRRLNNYWVNAKMKLEAERKEITRLQAALDNVLPHHIIEDELDKLELEMDTESEDLDLDISIDKIMNESGNVDTAEDDDYRHR